MLIGYALQLDELSMKFLKQCVGMVFCVLVMRDAVAQSEVPICTANRYGTQAQSALIERALQNGTLAEAQAALRAAQITRGRELGCSESGYSYSVADSSAPSLAAIRSAWASNANSAMTFADRFDACPSIGRAAGAYALGGWRARTGGLVFDEPALLRLSDNLLNTQYLAERTPGRQATWTGLFGYSERVSNVGDSCFVPGVVGEGVAAACATAPSLCATYESGRFRGQRFVVADYAVEQQIRDGGAGFDQGWAGVMMVEAALGATASDARERYRSAALAAGEWAIAEPPVRNHNYTAKLIWLLAVLYDWTGEARFRTALIDKLERGLLPGVLMDVDTDGQVDGIPGLRFAELSAPAARIPGRMWDAHNALPWYHAMNTWAMVEAYTAFRARGDQAWANRLRPYALAMLDNLAAELDGRALAGTGSTQPPFALATGLWKLADVEGLARPAWQRALWGFWSTSLANSPSESKIVSVATISLRAEGTRYRSYRELGTPSLATQLSGLWYDPARSGEGFSIVAASANRMVVTWYTYDPFDAGRQVWLIADGSFISNQFNGQALITSGTRFGMNFNPLEVSARSWGALQINFIDCSSAQLQWQSTLPGFGSGTRVLRPLTGVSAQCGTSQ